MIIFYDYYKDAEDLDSRDLYDYQLSTVNEICNGNPHNDYSNIRHIIVKDAEYAYWYARMYIKGRWPEAEPIIMKDARQAYWYAVTTINDRWLEAEPYIKADRFLWKEYCKQHKLSY